MADEGNEEGQKAKDDQHASVGDRLQYLEKLLGDSADKHSVRLLV